ncbi:hypothetical protein DV736_g3314, partial [Chaetothyriales sp. CBS 134916]
MTTKAPSPVSLTPSSSASGQADPKAAKDVMRTRILTHMNADHQFSLILYSRNYSKLPLSHAKSSKLEDIALTHMTIHSSFGRCMIPFDPPLNSLNEARERVVAMHQQAMKELDVEDVLIERYVLPDRAWMWVVMVLCAWTIVTFSPPLRPLLRPESGSVISRIWGLGGLANELAELAFTASPVVWPLTVLIHTGEAAYMIRAKLRRYQVEPFSGVWLAWVVDCFLEGIGSFVRFNEMVGAIRDERKRKKPEGRH